eukprot:TRINITY_DN1621_c0_g1_i2.p1 TRINITY_DN1621_c0_g1~~TRINITY_DN1621_c0_g1_i2.p1  ORF type:complete len:457 (-),score=103.25 TRINITY_DN1621_c0_g1_i2:101-1471(-)
MKLKYLDKPGHVYDFSNKSELCTIDQMFHLGPYCIKIGAGVSNDQLRKWCIVHKMTYPRNVVLVENLVAGMVCNSSHGSGINQQTVSDLVIGIEYVDLNGDVQSVMKNENELFLSAISGSFGLFGIIVSVTMKLEPLTYAHIQTEFQRVRRAIPPPDGFERVPKVFNKHLEREKDVENFENAILNSYYNEYFWFPYRKKVWVNNWNNDGLEEDAIEYPDREEYQSIETQLADLTFNNTWSMFLNHRKTSRGFSKMVGKFMEKALHKQIDVVTHLPNAMHFRRGIHMLQTRDFEVLVEIPVDEDGNPQLDIVRELWWEGIALQYSKEFNEHWNPMNLTIELRVMAGSKVLMAPQFGNKYTCAIEALALHKVNEEGWQWYKETLTNIWYEVAQKYGVRILPHWAKEHANMMGDQTMIEYIKSTCKDRMGVFLSTMGDNVAGNFKMFGNAYFRDLFGIE